MAVELKMPKMGLTMSTADVAKWLKNEGDAVKKGEPVVEVMTDKLSNQVESPADGLLLKIVAPVGAKLEAGGLLAFIGQTGEIIAEPQTSPVAAPPAPAQPEPTGTPAAAPSPAASGGRVVATPTAKALAREKAFDLSTIKGSGPGGRIIKEDVEAALIALASQAAIPEEAPPPAAQAVPAEEEVIRRVPYIGMRQVIGRKMHQSWTDIPRVTLHTQAAVDKMIELRQEINANCEPMDRVSITDIMVKLICFAVKSHPEINSRFNGQEMMVMKHVNLGVAVAIDGGLVVPVIKKAEIKSLRAVSEELKDFSFRAKNGSLGLDDMSGGTLTISNLGAYGSVDTFNPIINPPEVVIIGLGRSREIPIIVDGQVLAATVMSISVTHDHRVLDGAPVAAFMATLNALIENPIRGIF